MMTLKKQNLNISIDKTSYIPLYIQVYEALKEFIVNREFDKYGIDKLTEGYLEETLNVSRSTIRKAVSKLIDEGLLLPKRSQGIYFLKDYSSIMSHTINGLSFTETAIKRGQAPSIKMLKSGFIKAPEELVSKLNLEPEDKVFYSKRLRLINENPACISESYLPLKIFPEISENDITEKGNTQSVFYIMEKKYGQPISRWIETMSPIAISAADAKLLKVKKGIPGILRKQTVYSIEGKKIAYNEAIITNKYHLDGLIFKRQKFEM